MIVPTQAEASDLHAERGFCFMCSKDTFKECISEELFGSTYNMITDMDANIVVGRTPLYLFNFDTRQLHGIFLATSASCCVISSSSRRLSSIAS